MDTSKPWEIVVKFKTGATVGGNARIIGTNETSDCKGICVGFGSSTNLNIFLTSTGTSWNLANNAATGFNSLVANTTYWYKLTFDGTQYQSWYSTDGKVYTAGNIIKNSTSLVINSLTLGYHRYGASAYQSWSGSIDLSGCYIKSDGKVIWWGTYEENGQVIDSSQDADEYRFVINTQLKEFKLPLKNGQEGVFASGVKGNGMLMGFDTGNASVPHLGIAAGDGNVSGAVVNGGFLYGKTLGQTDTTGGTAGRLGLGLTEDTSRSGVVVDLDHSDEWNLYWWVGNTLKNPQLVNVARMQEQLVDHLSRKDKTEIKSWLLPDYGNKVTFTQFPITIPEDGYLNICTNCATVGTWYLYRNRNKIGACYNTTVNYFTNISGQYVVYKDDVITADTGVLFVFGEFYPFK